MSARPALLSGARPPAKPRQHRQQQLRFLPVLAVRPCAVSLSLCHSSESCSLYFIWGTLRKSRGCVRPGFFFGFSFVFPLSVRRSLANFGTRCRFPRGLPKVLRKSPSCALLGGGFPGFFLTTREVAGQ